MRSFFLYLPVSKIMLHVLTQMMTFTYSNNYLEGALYYYYSCIIICILLCGTCSIILIFH